MARCGHYSVCGRSSQEVTDDERFCILHSAVPRKDTKAFDEALKSHIQKKRGDFSSFVFPTDFDGTALSELKTTLKFSSAVFNGEADFSDSTFVGGIDFTEATFNGLAFFSNTKLKDSVFAGSKFNGYADFGSVEFHGRSNFFRTEFTQEANFSKAEFKQEAVFRKARFNEQTDFSDGIFAEEANFLEATFVKKVDFYEANYEKGVIFIDANFMGEANFMCAHFLYGQTNFSRVAFGGDAIFYRTEFAKKANRASFPDARFLKGANFGGACFENGAQFDGAQVKDWASFYDAKLKGEISFHGAWFQGRTLFAPALHFSLEKGTEQPFIFAEAEEVIFSEMILEPLDAVIFRDADLRKCRFQGTDLRKAEITGAKWPERGSRFVVYDEIGPIGDDSTRPMSHIEQLYRQLKQNYEDRRDYERARDFHYGEKEIRRKQSKLFSGLWLWLNLYKWVGGYGERWGLPLIWAGVVLLVSAVLYVCLPLCPEFGGLHPRLGGPTLTYASLWDCFRSLFYSFRVMTLLRPDDLEPTRYAKLIHAFQSLSGPLLLGLFALALRQRLKR